MSVFIKFSSFTIFLIFSSVQAASTSNNAVYNGAWTGVTSGTPSSNQNNTFNKTAGHAALLIQGGVAAYIDHSTNVINGGLIVEGDGTGNATAYLDDSTNTITGEVIVADDCVASLSRSNNSITGGVTANGSADFSAFGSGNATNTIDTVTANDNSSVNFSNAGSGTVTNTITSVTQAGNSSSVDLSNSSSGSTNNTLGTVSLSEGKMYVGGNSCTTQITTMDWTGGALNFVYANGGFGTTHIDTLNVTAPVTLALYNNDAGRDVQISDLSGTYTMLTVDTFTGDSNNISLVNTSPFVEVQGTSSSPNGISVSPDGKVTVTLVPVGTTSDSTTISAVTGAVDNTFITAMQNMEIADSGAGDFAPTSASFSRNVAYMKKSLRENSKNPFEAAVMALSAVDGPIVKSKGDYRVCLAPYALRIRNSGIASASGFTEKTYGFVLGGSHYFKPIDANLMLLIGMGASKTQQDVAVTSNTKGKSLTLGAVATKEIWDKKIDIISSLYGIVTKNRQARQGNPSPTQNYIALSHYNTKTLSWQNEAGYAVKFQDGYSIRPKIGVQLLASYRSAFSEQDAGVFAQKYRSRRQYSGEAYTGIGFRRKWNSNRYEGKITLSYDIGRLSGGRKSSVTVYADSAPSGVPFSQTKPGLTVQYINLNGSLLDKEKNWKIAPGASYSFQEGQHSLAGTLKLECRW